MQTPYTFDPVEATIDTVHDAIFNHDATCHQIVSAFLARIHVVNPKINALICLNPDALSDANTLDDARQRGDEPGPLFGVPVILKDNFNTSSMKSTGGCLALRDLQPTADAPLVSALKRAGAIVLGKANLHEMALEGLSVSSYGGQTINPYDYTRTPGGSSGGSGAAVAASLCVFATGTDTMNSLRSPASANRSNPDSPNVSNMSLIYILACSLVDLLVDSSVAMVSYQSLIRRYVEVYILKSSSMNKI